MVGRQNAQVIDYAYNVIHGCRGNTDSEDNGEERGGEFHCTMRGIAALAAAAEETHQHATSDHKHASENYGIA